MPVQIILTRNRFPEVLRQMRDEASKIVRETAFQIQTNVLEGMSSAHSGRIYGDHQASAPGEMPAIDIGNLIGSVQVEAEPGAAEAFVYTGAEYSAHLEFGTIHIAARPFMTPAVEQERTGFERRFADLDRMLR